MIARLATVALVIGCTAQTDETWHGDVTFTTEERAAIDRGYTFLARRLNAKRLDITWDAQHTDAPCSFATICRRERFADCRDGQAGLVSIDLAPADAPSMDALASLAAHEFGHWKGLQHHDGPGLMSATVPAFPMWTELDDSQMEKR